MENSVRTDCDSQQFCPVHRTSFVSNESRSYYRNYTSEIKRKFT